MTDRELQNHVQQALDWDPSVDSVGIAVSVDNGVVTLRGDVPSYSQKSAAERATSRVYGVKAVANDITVWLASHHERTDTEIAQAAVSALTWNSLVPADKVHVTVSNGWVRLSGTVDWQYQRNAAERAVRYLAGVKSVSNDITLTRGVQAGDVQAQIEAAFQRSAETDARRITVTAADDRIILEGHVRSWAERREAERAAWAAPGVTQVEDRLIVVP